MTIQNNSNNATVNTTTNQEEMIMHENANITTATVESNNHPSAIVQEADFPKKSSRLEQILSSYRKENQLPATAPVQTQDPLAKVKVVNEVKTKTFDELSPEMQKKVAARVDGVDYLNSNDIQTFASAKESSLTKHAEVIIGKYSASDFEELADPITDLVATIKSNNPKEIVKKVAVDPDKEYGFFSSLREMFRLKNAKKKMFKALANHDSIMKNIRAIEVELKKQQLDLRKDISIYQQMGTATVDQVNDFGLDCIALQLLKDDAQAKLDELTSKGELDLMEMNEAKKLSEAIQRIDRKMYSIQSVRVSTIQTIPELGVLVRGDEILCEKIDEISTLVIPLWIWQYAIAIGALKMKEALSIQKTIRGITSKLLKGNAQMLHDNMIAAQEELYAAAVAIEDLAIVQDYIDDMVSTVNEKSREASQKCVEGMKTMKSIEQKNYDLISQSFTVDSNLVQ